MPDQYLSFRSGRPAWYCHDTQNLLCIHADRETVTMLMIIETMEIRKVSTLKTRSIVEQY